MIYQAQITSLGAYLPERKVTNHELEKKLDVTSDWIEKRCGIKTRYWANNEESTSDLALKASCQAIERAKFNKHELDMIILATVTPDHEFPGTACFLQEKLGIKHCPVIDIRQQCTGFIFALLQAEQAISCGRAKNVLVVSAELHSKCLDLTPRGKNVSILFGDGAAACLVQRGESGHKEKGKILDITVHSDGSQAKLLWCPAPGTGFASDQRIDNSMLDEALCFPHMDGRQVYSYALEHMEQTVRELCTRNSLNLSDLDHIFFHQANLRIK
jgi:3-oxoacyl-[acyl-carrier-protein] synthase III